MTTTGLKCRIKNCNFGPDGSAYITGEDCKTRPQMMDDLRLHIDMDHETKYNTVPEVKAEIKRKKLNLN